MMADTPLILAVAEPLISEPNPEAIIGGNSNYKGDTMIKVGNINEGRFCKRQSQITCRIELKR